MRRVAVGLALVALTFPFLFFLSASPAAAPLAAADDLAARGKYREARSLYARAAALEPWRPAPLLRLGEVQFRLGQFAEAERSYRQAVLVHPHNRAAQRGLGRTLAAQGQLVPAAAAWLSAAQAGSAAEAFYEAGLLYLDLGDLVRAEATLSRAATLAEEAGEPALARGARLRLAFLVGRERPAAAEAQLDLAAVEAAPGERSRLTRAREALRALVSVSSPAHGDALLGRGALMAGLPSLAVDFLRRAVAAEPAYADAHAYLALALLSRGEASEAAGAAERALALRSGHQLARYARAAAWRIDGRPRDAILELKELLATSPDEASYLLELGTACADYGDFQAASDYVRRAVELPEAGPDVLLAAALFHVDRGYRPEQALPWAERADAALQNAEAAIARGWALHLVGQSDAALGVLARAAALDPRSARAHYYLGAALEEAGRAPEALREYARAIDLEPAGPIGQRARQSLLSLGERIP